MGAQAILTVSTSVVALTQLIKELGLPSRYAPSLVLLLSLFGVVLWGFSANESFQRDQLFSYFAGWVLVAGAAKGAYEGAKDVLKKVQDPQEPKF
jgi:hypothetical protein